MVHRKMLTMDKNIKFQNIMQTVVSVRPVNGHMGCLSHGCGIAPEFSDLSRWVSKEVQHGMRVWNTKSGPGN